MHVGDDDELDSLAESESRIPAADDRGFSVDPGHSVYYKPVADTLYSLLDQGCWDLVFAALSAPESVVSPQSLESAVGHATWGHCPLSDLSKNPLFPQSIPFVFELGSLNTQNC